MVSASKKCYPPLNVLNNIPTIEKSADDVCLGHEEDRCRALSYRWEPHSFRKPGNEVPGTMRPAPLRKPHIPKAQEWS